MATSWHLISLTVLGGTLHGKKLTIEDVVVEVLIGSDSDCHLHIDLPTVSPIHARLWIEPDDVTVYGTKSGPGVFVNFDRIDGDGKIQPGDLLWLGPPQAAGSVMLQLQFEERDTLPPVTVIPLADDELEAEASAVDAAAVPVEAATPSTEARVEVAPGNVVADEELGVLPEDAPTLLQRGLHPEPSSVGSADVPSDRPTPVVPPTEEAIPPASPATALDPPGAGGFDDFLVVDSAPTAASLAPTSADEFVVSGFEAEWPEASPSRQAEVAVAAPLPVSSPTIAPPAPAASEDAFFIDVGAEPPVGSVSSGDDAFFIDAAGLDKAPVVVPTPVVSGSAPPAADVADVSFAAAFLQEAAPQTVVPSKPPLSAPRPKAPTPHPVAKPAPAAPPLPKPPPAPVPSAPVAPKASPAVSPAVPRAAAPSPAVSQAVPKASLPSPSSTSTVRPLPRPDVSQSVSRGDRPPIPRAERTQALRVRRPPPRPIGRYAVIGAVGLAVLGGIGFAVSTLMRRVRLEKVEPARARVGETVALVGDGFASAPAGNLVRFDDKPAEVATATPTRLEVVVPDVATIGSEVRAAVRVRVGRGESTPVAVSVISGPVLHGISPDVAMPGDEVVLAGSSWGLGPSVKFGGLPADVMEARETSIRVRVPAIDGGPGTSAPVVVITGSVESNPGPFYVGRIPLVISAEPTSVAAGGVVTLTGRGFRRERSQNMVQIGGVKALVVTAFDSEVKVVVPRVPPGSRVLEVRVPSSVSPAQVPLVVGGAAEAQDFTFVAEPFDAVPGRDHAVVATRLGPAFVFASSGGRSAAERAVEAAGRLSQAAVPLRASRDLSIDLRDGHGRPTLGLSGRPDLLIEVTDEDAAAYGEDWTGLRGRGGPVSAGRLARWWEAVAKDLVLVLARSERPHFAVDLAPEGRALVDAFQAAQRPGGAVAVGRPPLRDALRLVAFRVPPAVRGPVTAAPISPPNATPSAAPASPAGKPMPRLEGAWSGSETEGGSRRFVSVTFRGSTGTIDYEGVMTVSAPLLSVDQPQRGAARFSVEVRGGLRYYVGRWDGQALAGKISTDPGGSRALGTFELRPR